jgi:hypothetical protein
MNASNTRGTETIGMPATTGQLTTARTQPGHATEGTPTRAGTSATAGKPIAGKPIAVGTPVICIKPRRQAEQQRRSIANVTSNMDVRFSRDAINTVNNSKSRKGSLDFRRSMPPATPGTIAGGEKERAKPEGELPIFGLRLLANTKIYIVALKRMLANKKYIHRGLKRMIASWPFRIARKIY